VVHTVRYKIFKQCNSFPYKKEFLETLENIRNLQPQFEWLLSLNIDNSKNLLICRINAQFPVVSFSSPDFCPRFLVNDLCYTPCNILLGL